MNTPLSFPAILAPQRCPYILIQGRRNVALWSTDETRYPWTRCSPEKPLIFNLFIHLFIWCWSVALPPQQLKVKPSWLQASQPAPLGAAVKLPARCLRADRWPPGRRARSTLGKWMDHTGANAKQRPPSSFLAPSSPWQLAAAASESASGACAPEPNQCCFSLKGSRFRRSRFHRVKQRALERRAPTSQAHNVICINSTGNCASRAREMRPLHEEMCGR